MFTLFEIEASKLILSIIMAMFIMWKGDRTLPNKWLWICPLFVLIYLQIQNILRLNKERNALRSTYRRSEKVVGFLSKCVSKLEEMKYNQKLLGTSEGIEEEF